MKPGSCPVPPPGWYCSRAVGHDGPCAAWLSRPKLSFFFVLYDFWVGAFWDAKKRVLYVCPIPCCVFKIKFQQRSA